MAKIQYVLVDEEDNEHHEFETEKDLENFLKEEGFSKDHLEQMTVYEVSTIYNISPRYELEEV